MRTACIATLLFGLPVLISAQQPHCPSLLVLGPSGIIKPGEVGNYAARVQTQGKESDLQYKWTVSRGEIVSGQGTGKIEVRNPEGWSMTVSVEVGGFPVGCPNTASETAGAPLQVPQAKKLADIPGPLSHASFSGEVDALNQDATAQLYVFLSGSKRSRSRSLEQKRKLVLANIAPAVEGGSGRITIVSETETNDKAVFWLVPAGATPPSASR